MSKKNWGRGTCEVCGVVQNFSSSSVSCLFHLWGFWGRGPEPLFILLEWVALLLPRKVWGGRVPAPRWLCGLESILGPQSLPFALSSLCCCPNCGQHDSESSEPGGTLKDQWEGGFLEDCWSWIIFSLHRVFPATLISGLIMIILPRGYDKGHTFGIYSWV